jgi:hypothetical protein
MINGAKLRAYYLGFLLSLAATSLAAASCSNAQTIGSGQKPGETPGLEFAGCYELMLGRWWPWSFGGDTILVTPPRRIQLLLTRGTVGFEKDRLLIRPISDIKVPVQGRGGPSYWQPKSDTQVDLEWNDGFTGVTLNLEKQGSELYGWAHPHFDAPSFIPRIERVVARKIACPIPN